MTLRRLVYRHDIRLVIHLVIVLLCIVLSGCLQSEGAPPTTVVVAPADWPSQLEYARATALQIDPAAVLDHITASNMGEDDLSTPLTITFVFLRPTGQKIVIKFSPHAQEYTMNIDNGSRFAPPLSSEEYANHQRIENQTIDSIKLSPEDALRKTLPTRQGFGPNWHKVTTTVILSINTTIPEALQSYNLHAVWSVLWSGEDQHGKRQQRAFLIHPEIGVILIDQDQPFKA